MCLLLISTTVFAQTQYVTYQGTAINSIGQRLINQSISLRLSILTGSASGSVVYVETQTYTTNATGAYNIRVGQGNAVSGTFASINWMNNDHFMKVEMDQAGGSNYVFVSDGPITAKAKIINSLEIQKVSIPAGTFTMGSPVNEINYYGDQTQHEVTLSGFQMSIYEITNAQFAAFLNALGIGSDGIYAAGAFPTEPLVYEHWMYGLIYANGKWMPAAGLGNRPIVNATWFGATEFGTFAGGRLPTEAEWEYACRANTTTPFNTGECLNNSQANYNWTVPYSTCSNSMTNYPNNTQDVGTYAANAFGLFDMHGNVWEWCSDWYGTYPAAPQLNPTGADSGIARVTRGGSWPDAALSCRSANRGYTYPTSAYYNLGFRLVFPQ